MTSCLVVNYFHTMGVALPADNKHLALEVTSGKISWNFCLMDNPPYKLRKLHQVFTKREIFCTFPGNVWNFPPKQGQLIYDYSSEVEWKDLVYTIIISVINYIWLLINTIYFANFNIGTIILCTVLCSLLDVLFGLYHVVTLTKALVICSLFNK